MFIKIVLVVCCSLVSILSFSQTSHEIKKIKSNGVDLSQYFEDKKFNARENTTLLNLLLREFDTVLMPNFTLFITDRGIDLRSNSVVFFQSNSRLSLIPSDKSAYQILRIHKKDNVQVYNAHILGDRKSHINNKGEWGMGISIKGSNNIMIQNANIQDCWGDGIYIGKMDDNSSQNIHIYNSELRANRRNGLSIISVKDLVVKEINCSLNGGTNPGAGIDIEPNFSTDQLANISLNNITSYQNLGPGLLLSLTRFTNILHSNFVNIKVDDFKDNGSLYAFRFDGGFIRNHERLEGSITISNVKGENNKYVFLDVGTLKLLPVMTELDSIYFNVDNDRIDKVKKYYFRQGIKTNIFNNEIN